MAMVRKNLPMPELTPVPGEDKEWMLDEDFVLEHNRVRYRVKRGFRTDGESIPRLCWWFTGHPFQGTGMVAAIIHDGLYGSELFTRDRADLVFKQLLERYGVSPFKAMMRYRALRIWGGLTWRTHTDKTRAHARKFFSVEAV